MITTNFRELQKKLAETEPTDASLYFVHARIGIDNWVVRQEKIYFYFNGKYLFTIENCNEDVEYEFLI